MSKRIGRNTPCPCGSGKKYKKCCLPGDWMDGKTLFDLFEEAVGWILGEPKLDSELKGVLEEHGNAWFMEESEFNLLLDAFLFDHKLGSGGTPFQYFLDHAKIADSHLQVYNGFQDNVFSVFEVLEVYKGVGMRMKDLLWEKEYFVKENEGSYQLEPGHLVFCRLSPVRSYFIILSPGARAYHKEAGYHMKRKLRQLRQSFREEMNAFTILDAIFGGDLEEDDVQQVDLETLKHRLKKKLDSLGIKIDFRGLSRRINQNTSPQHAFPEIYESLYPAKEDFNEILELLHALWNKHPRKEFGGKSPEEVDVKGPKEMELLLDLFEEWKMRLDPDDFASDEEFQNAVDKVRDEWLRTPQPELAGRTPRDVILEERRARGNPREDIAVRLVVNRIRDDDQTRADELYAEGLEAFRKGAMIKAADLFEMVTSIQPGNYKAWGNLGNSLAYLGKKEEAIECYRKALSLKPDYEIAKKNLCLVEDQSKEELVARGMLGAIEGIIHRTDGTKKDDDFDVWEEVNKKLEKKRKEEARKTE